ncbi:GtrA family protein [Candidatus Sulfopaludibacter sp. SbA6]|nr:GtrA family protein [Candidatus Sulfopaludibacter sp. SbA6]
MGSWSSLALLDGSLGLGYLPATALAVETAVLPNFIWHDRFTWKGRTEQVVRSSAPMRLLVGAVHVQYSLLNCAASEWFVFRRRADPAALTSTNEGFPTPRG